MIAGPYGPSRPPEERRRNLLALEKAARAVHDRGHMPVIGLNLALPIALALDRPFWDQDATREDLDLVNRLSLEAAKRCDAVLRIGGPSGGADAEVALIQGRGGRLYRSIEDVPDVAGRGSGAG